MASSPVSSSDSAAPAQLAAHPRTPQLKALRAALDQETAARQRLELALTQSAGTERMKLAQTLHDTVCQSVTAIYLMAKVVEINLRKSSPQEARQIAELSEIIHNVVQELRNLTSDLRGESAHAAAKEIKAAAKKKAASPARPPRPRKR